MFNLTQTQAIFGINNSSNKMQYLSHQLETGKRINYAKDDASGLSIANSLKSQYTGLDQAIRNANDAIGLTNIADSALQEYTDILHEAREKASQAISDTNSVESRAALEADVKSLMESAEAIAQDTSFNGIKLLDGSFSGKVFQTGAYSGQTTTLTIGDATTATLGMDDASVDLTTSAGADTAVQDIDAAIESLNSIRSNIGSTTKGLESRVRNMENTSVQIRAAHDNIMGVDEAAVKAELDQWTIRNQASMYAFSISVQTQQSILQILQ